MHAQYSLTAINTTRSKTAAMCCNYSLLTPTNAHTPAASVFNLFCGVKHMTKNKTENPIDILSETIDLIEGYTYLATDEGNRVDYEIRLTRDSFIAMMNVILEKVIKAKCEIVTTETERKQRLT
jgi:hypothetical protein